MPWSNGLGFVQTTDTHRVVTSNVAIARTPTAPCASTPSMAIPKARLVGWNAAMALFHTALATVTLALGNIDLRVPLYKTLLDFVPRSEVGSGPSGEELRGWDLVPSYGPGGNLNLTVLVATFFLLSALFHLLNATLLRSFYLRQLSLCKTPTRWIEYSLSAPIMILVISYGLGVRDRATIVAIAVLVGITMPFGYWTEVIARPVSETEWNLPLATRLFPWVLGHIPQVTAWFLIAWQFYDSVADATDRVPWFVPVILWGELVLFFSFGAAALLSQLGPPRDFYRGELLFQVLSLGSKGLLGGLMISNVLMLSRFDEIYE